MKPKYTITMQPEEEGLHRKLLQTMYDRGYDLLSDQGMYFIFKLKQGD